MTSRNVFSRELTSELATLRNIYWTLGLDMTNKALAYRAGICAATLRNFFTGKTKNPTFRTVHNIGRAVGVAVHFDGRTLRLTNAA